MNNKIEQYNPETDPENYHHVNYQGFPGQTHERNLTDKDKGWIAVFKIIFWIAIPLFILLAIL